MYLFWCVPEWFPSYQLWDVQIEHHGNYLCTAYDNDTPIMKSSLLDSMFASFAFDVWLLLPSCCAECGSKLFLRPTSCFVLCAGKCSCYSTQPNIMLQNVGIPIDWIVFTILLVLCIPYEFAVPLFLEIMLFWNGELTRMKPFYEVLMFVERSIWRRLQATVLFVVLSSPLSALIEHRRGYSGLRFPFNIW